MSFVCSPTACGAEAKLAAAAFCRSGYSSQISLISSLKFGDVASAAAKDHFNFSQLLCAVNPDEQMGDWLVRFVDSPQNTKMILFGTIPASMEIQLGFVLGSFPNDFASSVRAPSARSGKFSESPCRIVYSTQAHKLGLALMERAAERFDFADEWNNLGYGAVRADRSPWAVAAQLRAEPSAELARLEVDGIPIATYASLHDFPNASVLWFNRPVGPIDSFEWRLVEDFIANYRHEELPCLPIISEIPHGYDAAVTMRLDCDEDVESSRALFDAYRKMDVPFSLAVHTALLSEEANRPILGDVLRSGGSILSHSATHAPNWGGSYEAAYREATESKQALESLTGATVRYAVSPFHQTPSYALEALRDAGYAGCIGGIIRNDPEFLLARGGTLADLEGPFIGHSQQHMLHGDCLLSDGDPLAVSKQAFDLAMASKTIFGYLDHPFSARYQYGWSDESLRIAAHRELIGYIRSVAKKPLFLSEDRALDFISRKAAARLVQDGDRFRLEEEDLDKAVDFDFSAEYRGKVYNLSREEIPA
jgi:hypothetical protein